jgi:hypothetical protein
MSTTQEYVQLKGVGTSGDFVKEQQGTAEGFSFVSQFWLPQTLSYQECIENMEKERDKIEDIKGKWADWKFSIGENGIELVNQDGRGFQPTQHAINQASGYCEVIPSFIHKTLSPEFQADETDLQQLVDMMNYRKVRYHQTNKNEDRELTFRTYNNSTLRAVLSTQYMPINNSWLIGLMETLVPGGRISHLRGDLDNMYCNVLLPDNVRYEEDSGYGGMFSIRNSEIGQAAFDCQPSVLRSICRNGCLHNQTKGISFRQVHKGKLDLKTLAVEIGENLHKQIKLIPVIMENYLRLRQYEFHDVALTGVFANIVERFRLTPAQGSDIISQFAQFEKTDRTAFGVVNALTRSGQLYDAETTLLYDSYGGQLVGADWDGIVKKANSYSKEDIAKLLGLSI